MWKRVLATGAATILLLFGVIFLVGTFRLYLHPEPGGDPHEWIAPGLFAGPCLGGGLLLAWLLRPPLDRALLLRPSVQAVLLYLATLPILLFLHPLADIAAFCAFCAFTVSASVGALLRPRWVTTALAAVVWSVILFGALVQTAEDATGHSVGEGAMVYLLPMTWLPVLLVVAGAVRLARRPPEPPR